MGGEIARAVVMTLVELMTENDLHQTVSQPIVQTLIVVS